MSSTLQVMVNGGLCLGPVAAWEDGKKVLDPGSESVLGDVFLVAGGPEKDGRPRFAALVHRLLPWRGQFVGGGGERISVQSFRCAGIAGNVGWMLYCSECGYVHRCDSSQLQEVGLSACKKCGALPIGTACERFHNWGVCPDCSPKVCESSRPAFKADECNRRGPAAVGTAEPQGGALGILAGSAGEKAVGGRVDACA